MREWPLRARQAQLSAAVDAVVGGPGVMLAGEAGVGKSRLAREISGRLRSGYEVTWVATSRALRQVPFGAMLPYLDAPSGEPMDQVALLQCLWQRFGSRGGRPRLLVVDDAHDLDEASAGVVRQMVFTGTRVMLTVRLREPAGEELARLWRDRQLTRLVVEPFDRSDVRAVLEGALGGPVDVLTTARMCQWTGGNALHLRELVDAGLASGSLRPVRGVWQWAGDPVVGDAR